MGYPSGCLDSLSKLGEGRDGNHFVTLTCAGAVPRHQEKPVPCSSQHAIAARANSEMVEFGFPFVPAKAGIQTFEHSPCGPGCPLSRARTEIGSTLAGEASVAWFGIFRVGSRQFGGPAWT